jgi:hypothetical protein
MQLQLNGTHLQPRTQELHRLLGTWPDFNKQAASFPEMVMYDPETGTRELQRFTMYEKEEPTSAKPYVGASFCPSSISSQ